MRGELFEDHYINLKEHKLIIIKHLLERGTVRRKCDGERLCDCRKRGLFYAGIIL